MQIIRSIILALGFVVAGGVAAVAGPFQYECTIEEMYSDDGSRSTGLRDMYKTDKIFIERSTGIILHPYWAKKKSDIGQRIVLHNGNSSSYFKAVTYTVSDVFVAVTVKEFAVGAKKPMALLVNGKVITGYCF